MTRTRRGASAPRRASLTSPPHRCRTARCPPPSIPATARSPSPPSSPATPAPSRTRPAAFASNGADLPPRAARRHRARARHRPGPRAARDDRPADPRGGGRPSPAGLPLQARHRPQLRDGQHLPLQRLRQRIEERRPDAHRDVSQQVARRGLRPRADRGGRRARHAGRQGVAGVGRDAQRAVLLARLPAHHASDGARERRGQERQQPRRPHQEDAGQLERRPAGAQARDRAPRQEPQPRPLRRGVRRRRQEADPDG